MPINKSYAKISKSSLKNKFLNIIILFSGILFAYLYGFNAGQIDSESKNLLVHLDAYIDSYEGLDSVEDQQALEVKNSLKLIIWATYNRFLDNSKIQDAIKDPDSRVILEKLLSKAANILQN